MSRGTKAAPSVSMFAKAEFGCTACGARPGARCIGASGRPTRILHMDRRQAALEARRDEDALPDGDWIPRAGIVVWRDQ